MKLCHFSDSHLGAGENHPRRAPSGLTERQEDVISGFVEAVDRIVALKPDVCVHSGDLFHSVRPYNSIMAIAAEQLHRLTSAARIPTVIISGNHDAPREQRYGAPLDVLRNMDNLYVASRNRLETFDIKGIRFFALPHCTPAAELQRQLAACMSDEAARFNVLVVHGVAAGMPEFSMADLGEQEIPLAVINRFDYTALGHYHNFRQVGPRAWYAGSTERLSQGERDSVKGFVEIDLDPFAIRFHEVTARVMVTLPEIDATGVRGDQLAEHIKKQVEAIGSGDKIIRVKVRNVAPETLNTLPAETLAALKKEAFSLDISFEKAGTEANPRFGKAAVGRLGQAFARYLETADLAGMDHKRLLEQALRYLDAES